MSWKKLDIQAEVIDLVSIKPIDYKTIFQSITKTGRLLVLETSHTQFSVGSEIISSVSQNCFSHLKNAPSILGKPNIAEPTGFDLTKKYHFTAYDVIIEVLNQCKVKNETKMLKRDQFLSVPHDIPDPTFDGPF